MCNALFLTLFLYLSNIETLHRLLNLSRYSPEGPWGRTTSIDTREFLLLHICYLEMQLFMYTSATSRCSTHMCYLERCNYWWLSMEMQLFSTIYGDASILYYLWRYICSTSATDLWMYSLLSMEVLCPQGGVRGTLLLCPQGYSLRISTAMDGHLRDTPQVSIHRV